MDFIRKKGLVALIISSAVIVLIVFLFTGPIVKSILESQLGDLNGAEVNIDELTLSLSPLGLQLKDTQFTDKEQPANNLVSIKNIVISLKADALISRKVIIPEMEIYQLQFATKRESVGDVYQPTVESDGNSKNDIKSYLNEAGVEFPNADELIEKTQLLTPAAYEKLQQQSEKTEKTLSAAKTYFEEQDKWQTYDTRYQAIKKQSKQGSTKDKLKAIKALSDLKKEVSKELELIKQHKQNIKTDYDQLNLDYQDAKAAPKKDLNNIKSNYSMDEKGLGNVSQLLFGETIGGYISQAKKYYQQITPYLESDGTEEQATQSRLSGRHVRFDDNTNEPDFLIEHVKLNILTENGEYIGTGQHLTLQQNLQNKTSRIKLAGNNLKHSKMEVINIELDVRNKKKTKLRFDYDIKQRQISNYVISKKQSLPIEMQQALMNMQMEMLAESSVVQGRIKSDFNKVRFSKAKDDNDKGMSAMIIKSLAKVDDFTIDTRVSGKLSKPKIKIKSDIDNKVSKQLKAEYAAEAKAYEKSVEEKYYKKYGDTISAGKSSMDKISAYKSQLDIKQQSLEDKLKGYK